MKLIKRISWLFTIVCTTTAIVGCVSVHNLSSNLAPNEQATLKGGGDVRLASVDSQKGPNQLGFGSTWDGSFTVYLSPGTHSLGLAYYEQLFLNLNDHLESERVIFLKFDAKAGHVYSLVTERDKRKWRAFIKDNYDGQETADSLNFAEGNLLIK